MQSALIPAALTPQIRFVRNLLEKRQFLRLKIDIKKDRNPLIHKGLRHGALQGIRTPDLLVRSQTLYPTELAAQIFNCLSSYRQSMLPHSAEKINTYLRNFLNFYLTH